MCELLVRSLVRLFSRNFLFFFVDQIPVKRHFEFDKNHFHVIELESSLDQGVYITTVEYSGKYSDDLRGLYKAYFWDKNGNKS